MTKAKSSPSSIVVPSIFVMHLLNGEQVLNATSVCEAAITVLSPPNKM